jgi:iron complex transport system ATP-binding protein
VLEALDLHFAYGDTPVLRGVSMHVQAGGFLGLIGPNGSGKTTLLRLLAGTRKPDAGSVELDGRNLSTLPRGALARRMAVVPQETHLAFDYTVLELVLMGRYPHLGAFEVEGPGDIAIAREALDATGTLPLQDRLFETLSGGEKQRVVIAAALAQITAGAKSPGLRTGSAGAKSPGLRTTETSAGGTDVRRPGLLAPAQSPAEPILLLDEPTAALDLRYQLEVASLLGDLQRRMPLAIVVSTHDLNFASSVCRTVVMLKTGTVVASGPAAEVLTAENIRAVYDVEADVHRHAATGRLLVVPLSRGGGAHP